MSGCRRMVPVEEQGASSRTASNNSPGCHVAASASTQLGLQAEPRRGCRRAKPAASSSCRPRPPRRRRARVAPSCRRAPRRDRPRACPRRRRAAAPAATPPRPAPTTRPRRNRAAASMRPLGRRRTLPVGSTRPRESLRPKLRVALDGEIERRLDQMRRGDGVRARLAPPGDPARPQPVGRVDPRRIEAAAMASPSLATRRSTALTSLS